jgi:hypothetical protein
MSALCSAVNASGSGMATLCSFALECGARQARCGRGGLGWWSCVGWGGRLRRRARGHAVVAGLAARVLRGETAPNGVAAGEEVKSAKRCGFGRIFREITWV